MSNNEKKKGAISIFQGFEIGSIAGAIETGLNHPLWVIKTRLQSGLSFSVNPSVLYRGVLPNAMSMIPITAIQVGLDQWLQRLFFDKHTMSQGATIASAFAAGVGSSFVSCPTEMVMTRQNKMGGAFVNNVQIIKQQQGWRAIWRGLTPTAAREGIFTAFYLAVTQSIKEKYTQKIEDKNVATVLAGISAGMMATMISQPFDTVKAVMQSGGVSASTWNTTKSIYASRGVHGFFVGSLARGGRVISAITLLGMVNAYLTEWFLKLNEQSDEEKPGCRF